LLRTIGYRQHVADALFEVVARYIVTEDRRHRRPAGLIERGMQPSDSTPITVVEVVSAAVARPFPTSSSDAVDCRPDAARRTGVGAVVGGALIGYKRLFATP
jgi:hypothetical protein